MNTQSTVRMADILLTLLYVNNHTPIASKKKLFKTLKYFQDQMLRAFNSPIVIDESRYEFSVQEFGLFSGGVVDDLEFFAELGYIHVRKLEARNLSYGTYYIAGTGKKYVEEKIIRN